MKKSIHSDKDIEPGQDWDIYRFQPSDAQGIVRIFRGIYGDGYPVKTYLDPQLLIQANAEGEVISSVAKTSRGDVVGHNALFNSAAHPGTYESGAGGVHAAYRGVKGIFTRMVDHGLEVATSSPRVNTVFCEPVCNHVYSQKLTEKAGFVLRALEADLMPSAAYEKETSAAGRVSAFLTFRTFRPNPHRVYLPSVYQAILPFFYENLDDEREFCPSDATVPQEAVSDIRPRIFNLSGVVRVAIHEVGLDFLSCLARLEQDLQQQMIQVIQVWLNLACPWVGVGVEVLKERGYFLGGSFPDGLTAMGCSCRKS